MKILKWKELKSTVVPKLLKAPFPKCGVKYTSQFGRGLVLIKYDVCNKKMVMEKGKAAGDNSLAFIIPKVVANVYNI
jgi:hypothetical protein